MTTTPDPKTVREIAEEVANIALHDAVHVDQWISAVVERRFGNECSQFRAPLHIAVARRMAVVTPSWPDEQPQDGDPCAVCYCHGCPQCVNPTPPSEVCFCMKAVRPETTKVAGEQPQDERCPECGASGYLWRADDRECEVCVAVADVENAIDDLAEKVEQQQADPDIRHLTVQTKLIVAHMCDLAQENAKLRTRKPQDERDARIAELESERDRYRTAWRLARQRAKVAGWAADKYADRSRSLHEAAMDLIGENLELKFFGPAAVAEADAKAAQDQRDALGTWLDARQADIVHDHDRPGMTQTSCYCGLPWPCEQRADDMAAIEQLRAILGRRAELVAENARLWKELEAAQAGRDGDVRAVERARGLIEALWNGDAVTADAEHVLAELDARFAPAIAALDARDEHAASQDRVDDGFAWHELHYGLGPDPLGPEPESRYYQLFHAEQCLTLPTGAACWADHEPHRHWWPAEDGEYRIRPVEMSGGGTEDGPNEPTLTMEIQVRAGEEWVDYNGPCVGDLEARDAGDGR